MKRVRLTNGDDDTPVRRVRLNGDQPRKRLPPPDDDEPFEQSRTSAWAKHKAKNGGFTVKQRRFIDEYQLDGDETKAAVRAGYSSKTAYVIGSENLRKPTIAAEINRVEKERSERIKLTVDAVRQRLAEIGFHDLPEKIGVSDQLTALGLLAKHMRMIPTRVEVSGPDGGEIEVKQMNVNMNLEELASIYAQKLRNKNWRE